jgi:hypothetical protein
MSPEFLFWLALAVKMAVTAAFVVGATMAAERAGAFIGALIATLPISAGPSFVFLALDHPPEFIAAGALHGVVINCANAVYMAIYVVVAQRHSLLISLAIPLAAWLVIGSLLLQVDWGLATALSAVISVIALCVLFTRDYRHAPMPSVRRQWYDVPLRAFLVAALVGAVVTLSFHLGPERTGVLAAAPIVMTSIMTLMHWRVSGRAAAAVIANCISGLGSVLTFLLVIYLTVVPFGPLAALTLGFALSIVWNLALYATHTRPAAI